MCVDLVVRSLNYESIEKHDALYLDLGVDPSDLL